MNMCKKLNLGYYDQEAVYTNTEEQMNGAVALIGGSGSGKTTEAERIGVDVARHGGTVVVISAHGSLSIDQISPYYADLFRKYSHDISVSRDGIPLPLFDPVVYPDGEEESIIDTIGAVTDILCRAFRFGVVQKAALRAAVEEVVKSGTYRTQGFQALGKVLRCEGSRKVSELYERMRFLFEHNTFVHGPSFIQEGRINVVHLEKMDLYTQTILTEMLMAYIWRMANADQFKTPSGLYLIIDEAQNLCSNREAPLALLLSEGRRMGVNLILATQMILQGGNVVQQRIPQCGVMLYFKPAANRLAQTARMIAPGNESQWVIKLRTLKKGEFVAVGSFQVGEEEIDYPLIVSANINEIKDYDELLSESGD